MKGVCVFLLLALLVGPHVSASDEVERGIMEYRSENFEEALEIFTALRARLPKSSLVAFYLGLTYKQLGELKEAKVYLREALNLTPPVLDAYVELIDVLYALEDLSEALRYIEAAERAKIFPARIAFLKGLVLSRTGKGAEAIAAFEDSKRLDPSLSQAADLQIAMIYARERRLKKARDVLGALINMDPRTDIAGFAREYEASLRKVIEAYRPWRFSLSALYTYDTNVISKPVERIGISEIDLAKEKDNGVVSNFRMEFRPLMEGKFFFASQLGLTSTDYSRIHTHDFLSPSLLLNAGYNLQRLAFSIPLSYNYNLLHNKGYSILATARPTLNFLISETQMGQVAIAHTRRIMLRRAFMKEEDRDGRVLSASTGYSYSFLNGGGILSFRYEYVLDDCEGQNWDNKGPRVSGALVLPLKRGVSLSFSSEYFAQDYEYVHTVFNKKRKDRNYVGSINLSWEIRKALNLSVGYSYTRARSNIDVYEYKRGIFTGGLEYAF